MSPHNRVLVNHRPPIRRREHWCAPQMRLVLSKTTGQFDEVRINNTIDINPSSGMPQPVIFY